MPDLFPDGSGEELPELAMVVAEIERELIMRKGNYPRWTRSGRMSGKAAERQIRLMEAARLYLLRMGEQARLITAHEEVNERQAALIVKLKAVVARVSEQTKPPPVRDPKAEHDNMGG